MQPAGKGLALVAVMCVRLLKVDDPLFDVLERLAGSLITSPERACRPHGGQNSVRCDSVSEQRKGRLGLARLDGDRSQGAARDERRLVAGEVQHYLACCRSSPPISSAELNADRARSQQHRNKGGNTSMQQLQQLQQLLLLLRLRLLLLLLCHRWHGSINVGLRERARSSRASRC